MTTGADALQSHVTIVDYALPRIFLPIFIGARMELALMLLIVLFAKGNLPLTFGLPLL